MNEDYIVKDGDTLSRIAKKHNTTARELARINHLQNINVIRVGQVLHVPWKLSDPLKLPDMRLPDIDLSKMLSFEFFDAANNPIDGMKVKVEVAGKTHLHKTDSTGKIPVIPAAKDDKVEVLVEKLTGGLKKVSEIIVAADAAFVRIISPKVMVKSEMKVHEGPAQAAKTDTPKPQPVGTEVVTRSEAGNPVHGVTVECPNPENLKLLANAKYRDVIIAASKRSGFSPQAIAAIMNAEAATLTSSVQIPVVNRKSGKPALDKTGKPIFKTIKKNDGEWDAHSASPKSSARGMTQFLDGSWIGMMLAADSFLNSRAKKEGWLTTTTVSAKKKTDKDKLTSQSQAVQAFKLADGKFVTKTARRGLAQVLSSKPYVTARATASDANLQKLLDLRYEPEYAINTAVDYGIENLEALKSYGFKIDGITDGDKAKLIYLTHHLGSGDAKGFINNTIGNERAKVLLDAQVGAAKSAQYAADNGDSYVKGHRAWLCTFVDNRIKLSEKMCDPSKTTAVRTLLDVTVAIR
jgi:murein DD-endopeptidase MepM/ murein hydrolase activator NlpD